VQEFKGIFHIIEFESAGTVGFSFHPLPGLRPKPSLLFVNQAGFNSDFQYEIWIAFCAESAYLRYNTNSSKTEENSR